MAITKRFKDPLTRQGNEAVRISNRAKNSNSKTEFNHPPISRITIEKSKKIVKKYPENSPRNRLNHQSNFTTKSSLKQQCPGAFLSGTEDSLNSRTKMELIQKQLNSEQENDLESTLLIL